MNIKNLFNRLFYLNTRGINKSQATNLLSSIEVFLLLCFFTILKKIFFPNLNISLLLGFGSFIVIGLIIKYFNDKIFESKNNDYTKEWESETVKNKMIYKICNVIFIVFTFSMFAILSLIDKTHYR